MNKKLIRIISVLMIMIITINANNIVKKENMNDVTKTQNSKVLCVMLNVDNSPFNKEHDEKYYYDQLFGENSAALKNYIYNQSNGKYVISPADTINTKYPGIIKLDVKATPKYATENEEDYSTIYKFVKHELNNIEDKVDWKAIDKNNDKRFVRHPLSKLVNADDELSIITVISGESITDKVIPNKIESWAHSTQLLTKINDYIFNQPIAISSEYTVGPLNYATIAHEFLHDLGARDMYNDDYSIKFWSVMDTSGGKRPYEEYQTPTPLDPLHKIFFGWVKPKKIKFNEYDIADMDFNKNEIPYLVDDYDPNIIYLFDYHDFTDPNQKSLYEYGVEGDGLTIWKVNKKEAKRDWYLGEYIKPDHMINSKGKGTAMEVIIFDKPQFQNQIGAYIEPHDEVYVNNTYRTSISEKHIHITSLKRLYDNCKYEGNYHSR